MDTSQGSQGGTGEARNLDAAVATLNRVDEKVQLLRLRAGVARADSEEMVTSVETFHASMKRVDIDDETITAADDLRTSTDNVSMEAGKLAAGALTVSSHLLNALTSLGGHRKLSDQVKAHPRAAALMGWYR